MAELDFIYTEVKFLTDRLRDEDIDAEYESEWKFAARVFDR